MFTWSYQDMPGLATDIVTHKLAIKPEFTPIKQKLLKLKSEWSLKVKEEVIKQFEANFIMVVNYPTWLANVVPVPKKDGRIQVCVDYRDLNKVSQRMIFLYPTSTYWLIIQQDKKSILSWMDFPTTIKSYWTRRIGKRPPSSLPEALSTIESCHSGLKILG